MKGHRHYQKMGNVYGRVASQGRGWAKHTGEGCRVTKDRQHVKWEGHHVRWEGKHVMWEGCHVAEDE